MRNIEKSRFLCQINPKNQNIQQFYDPLTPTQLLKIKQIPIKSSTSYRTLFDENDEQQNMNYNLKIEQLQKQKQEDAFQDKFLNKILANSKLPKKSFAPIKKPQKSQVRFQTFDFSTKLAVSYPQTPHFKSQLLSPFWKFNKDNKPTIQILQKSLSKPTKSQYPAIQLDSDPLLYVTQPIKYFIGLGNKMKQDNMNAQMGMFYKLACYTQPYSQRAWKKYIQDLEQKGQVRKCMEVAKTAFLFCPVEDFAKVYISQAEKCALPVFQIAGVMTNIISPDLFQKGILAQIGKTYLKYKQNWKGIKILFEICIWNQFKLPVCALINFLAKTLQNFGQRDKALQILKRSFSKNMSKLEIYTLYLEMKNRQQKGEIKDNNIKEVQDYAEIISGENRYKLYLEIAQILFKQKNENYKNYLQKSYFAAKLSCAQGTGRNKAFRHIFFSVLRCKKKFYPLPNLSNLVLFEQNRQRYIKGYNLAQIQFNDWKYYLHFGLLKRDDLLLEASKKWPYTGRLVAEWIHCLRQKRPINQVLRIWREKIKEVPKSGELWCQGGRIYLELRDYQNASKCFKSAIHFTPQYGDSFFQQLKILLIKGKFRQINNLQKLMFVSDPFYGHVWSFLRSQDHNYKLSLSNLWDLAIQQIKDSLYKKNIKLFRSSKPYKCQELTALSSYNQAVQNPDSQQIRVRLFTSYQQIESKS